MDDFAKMNEIWDAWITPGTSPARACGEAKLALPEYKVEVIVVAARKWNFFRFLILLNSYALTVGNNIENQLVKADNLVVILVVKIGDVQISSIISVKVADALCHHPARH